MRPINPNSLVAALRGDPSARVEVSKISPVADDGVFEVQTLTMPTVAAATSGDLFIVENKAGLKMAVWLDKAGTNSPPSGPLYSAADVKIRANISTDTTAIEVAARVIAAMTAGSPIAALTRTDNLDGTISFTATKVGNVTAPVVKNAAENAAGSVTATTTTGGVACTNQNKYVVLVKASGALFHLWMNINSEGTDPAPADSTGIAVAVEAGASAETIAAAMVAAINTDGNFAANLWGSAEVQVHNPATGAATDLSAGSGCTYSVAVQTQGQAVEQTAFANPADTPSGISINPSAIT